MEELETGSDVWLWTLVKKSNTAANPFARINLLVHYKKR